MLEVLGTDREAARALLDEVRRLMVELNVFRGQVLAFGESQMGHVMLGPIVFLRRPELGRDQLILPDDVLESVEREVFGVAEQRERLRASGQHVKRGMLLWGPPGTGKTHTVRYLISRLREHTVFVLTGGGLHMVRSACALARMLQPSVVVLEDIDLVAQHREAYGMSGNPLLFDVLNEIDGIAEDADVTFVLDDESSRPAGAGARGASGTGGSRRRGRSARRRGAPSADRAVRTRAVAPTGRCRRGDRSNRRGHRLVREGADAQGRARVGDEPPTAPRRSR